MKIKLLLAASSMLLIFFSCNNKSSTQTQVADIQLMELDTQETHSPFKNDKEKDQVPVGKALPPQTMDSSPVKQPAKAAANIDWDKKIIKTAHIKIEVPNFKIYNTSVHQTVKKFGGYIAQERQQFIDEKSETVLSIKVPVAQFEDMMNQLPGNDGKVMERTITSEDVTGEMVDTKSRLEARKQMRLKYLDFLKQSKNMEEVLQVQTEINGIQEDIESASGRILYLSHQSSYSTINLTFYQPMAGFKPDTGTPSFFTRIATAFKIGTAWVGELLIGLMSIWPLLIIIAGGILIWKKRKPVQKISASV